MIVALSYDLNRLGQRWSEIDKLMKRLEGVRVLETMWVTNGHTVDRVYEAVKPLFDDNDHWFVCELRGPSMGRLPKEFWAILPN